MRPLHPKRVSILLTATLTLLAVTGGIIYYFRPGATTLLLIIPLFLFIAYLVIYFSLDRFISDRIRVLYKTVHNLRSGKGGTDKASMRPADLLEQVNREVEEWARDRKEEIEQLRAQESYRKEFIGNVSHELKTPIFNIQGYLLTLLEGGLDDPAINRDYLQRAEKSVERMITIVEDLETITRLESGQLHLEMESFDLVRLVREVMESEEMRAGEKGIGFRLDLPNEKQVKVIADRDRIRQVLTNLLVNSVKYGRKGGYTSVSFFDMDENLLVEVSDNGPGIPEKELPRLFERFYRVDKSRSREQGGSGLGLAIVKHIIEAHRQTISVRSETGVGSTFSFTLKKA